MKDPPHPMVAAAKTKPQPTHPRKANRQVRRKQLIEATISVLAERGQTGLKLQDVAEAAGLSYGLVNFHFETKDKLLAETLSYMAAEYQANWQEMVAAAGDEPAKQLNALIQADFHEKIFTRPRVLAWSTFWGEAQSRPHYQEQCGAKDTAYIRVMEGICARVLAEGGQSLSAERAARVLRVTIEGVWLDFITMDQPYSRREALRTVYTCAMVLFPKHFDDKGLIR
ncbi:MAG: TetR/AcrR family transcriptional regulator [Hyphomicrobium sp.]|uniref:TetR/AcrR family transcriptional regulator n=1 Tax=Hyphomicrobium sp. TaxID=82 RepID=UPI003D0F2C63